MTATYKETDMQNWYGNYPMNMMFDKDDSDDIKFWENLTERTYEYINSYYDDILEEWKKYGATEHDVDSALENLEDKILDIAYNSYYDEDYNFYECVDYLLQEDTIKQYMEEYKDELDG